MAYMPGTEWPTCENYRKALRAQSLNDKAATMAAIDVAMEAIKSDFDNKINALYSKTEAVVHPHLNQNTGDIEKWQLIKPHLESNKTEDLMRIQPLTSIPHAQVEKLYLDYTSGLGKTELDYALEYCDNIAKRLWIMLGEADQRIKKKLADGGLPAPNRIVLEVEASIPDSFQMQVERAVTKKQRSKRSEVLWHQEAMVASTEIIRKDDTQVKAELKALHDRFAHRIAKAKPTPNPIVDISGHCLAGIRK